MRAQLLTAWTVTDNANAPRLPVDHPLPAGASWMDVTGQQSYQIPSLPDAYVVECWHVSQAWLDSVAADDRYLVLWSAADDAVPDAALTADQLAAIRAHFDGASTAQLDRYIGTQPDDRTVAEVADAVREWSKLFLRQDEMDPADYARLVNRYPQWQAGATYAAGELLAYQDALYEVVQAHTSQPDWLPDATPRSICTLSRNQSSRSGCSRWAHTTPIAWAIKSCITARSGCLRWTPTYGNLAYTDGRW